MNLSNPKRPKPSDPLIHLCILAAPVRLPDGRSVPRKIVNRFKLRWTTHHAQSIDNRGAVIDFKGAIFDAHTFRVWRDERGAWIECSDPDFIREAMQMEPGESLGVNPLENQP